MKTALTIIVVAWMLTGCAAKYNDDMAGPFPAHYKQIIKNHIERTYFDPYSLRSVSISATPSSGVFAYQSGWWVCVECNGKNRMGGYVGLERKAYLIAQNQVAMTLDGMLCDTPPRNNFQPWPEMEMLGDKK